MNQKPQRARRKEKGAARKQRDKRIIFVTGTGTGVGKTVFTTLLLAHLRGEGRRALAVKPFCSGGRQDAEALWAFQKECLTLAEVNPYYFDKPVAPRAAGGSLPALREVVNYLNGIARRCDALLIEGSGGLLVPLGRAYTVADLIKALNCEVIVVARNELGTINHSLLTLKCLQTMGIRKLSIVMMETGRPDPSSPTNPAILGDLAPETPVVGLPFLGPKPLRVKEIKKSVTFLQKTLAQIFEGAIVSLLARKGGKKKVIDETG